MSQSRRNYDNMPQPPSVPTIQRRSNSVQRDDDAVMLVSSQNRQLMSSNTNAAAHGNSGHHSNSAASSATDEFGFPITQHQSASTSSRVPHVNLTTRRIDLERVVRPSNSHRLHHSAAAPVSHNVQQYRISQPYSNNSNTSMPPQSLSLTRNNSTTASPSFKLQQAHTSSSSARSLQKVPSSRTNHASSSSSNTKDRPPRSQNSHYHQQQYQQLNQSTSSSKSHKQRSTNKPPRIKIFKPPPQTYNNYTFQHPSNAMRLTIRTVDLSHRIAFDTRLALSSSSANLQRMLMEMDRVRGSRSTLSGLEGNCLSAVNGGSGINGSLGGGRNDNPCRISPSPNHMAILEFMHGSASGSSAAGGGGGVRRKVIRQLQWNAACSIDADPWFNGTYEDAASSPNKQHTNSQMQHQNWQRPNRRKPKSPHGDGRYLPINPLAATRALIPNHAPLLTNKKRRLPMRCDVGFSNPTKEEITKKMGEVGREAEWEEASPRIVLLGSGFGLFMNHRGANGNGTENACVDIGVDELHESCQGDAKLWAGGVVPGVPFAGRDLVAAYKMSYKFEQESESNQEQQQHQPQQQTTNTDNESDLGTNPYSIFAPPIDATFSSSHQWRPRPFTDRPPGHVYFLACPLDVRFEGGDVEPLFCTLTCYSLPNNAAVSDQQQQQWSDVSRNDGNNENGVANATASRFRGKISEDFFFPAGDWNGIEGVEGSFDEDDNHSQSWRIRKRRAILSYDPLEVSPHDLHLVIQVYRMIRSNKRAPALQQKKGIGSKIKRSLLSREREKSNATARQYLQTSSISIEESALIGEVGAQYLTPVCFSITPAFSRKNGTQQKQESAMVFPFPEMPESQEDFVKRLVSITINPSSQLPANKGDPKFGSGYTDVFVSHLGRDFTRALLDEPPQLQNATTMDDAAPLGPQLLADVMGDCAISFDGLMSEGAKKQRSKLRRLPPSQDSGYSSSFDLKEVLYLPPRSQPRKYEEDTALCSSTVLNLLYVYPRLIRWNSSQACNSQMSGSAIEHLTIRVQVVEQELPPDQHSFDASDPTYQALQSIYNPSSPAGPPLIESFFTKLVARQMDGERESSKTKPGRKDFQLKDEVKVRLPDVLDRRHFLQFSLFIVTDDADIELIAETTIPFIISSKESTSGGRVTTVIPNGLHRIQLSDGIQIHAESRLASSSHISDPSVATLLRDYPLVSSAANMSSSGAMGDDMDASSTVSDVIIHSSSGFPFLDILSMASGQAVKRHFLALITVNLLNFFRQVCPPFYFESLSDIFVNDILWHRLVAWETTEKLLAITRSLFEILDKTRTSYQERDGSMLSLQYQRLVKSFLDTFDEPLFTNRHSDMEVQHAENVNLIPERHFNESMDSSQAYNDSYSEEPSSALSDPKDDQRRIPKYQFTSPRNNINPKEFSRKAFVATRSEQMKAESELNDDGMYGREFFDDDETVVTLGTIASRLDAGSVLFPVILETKSFTVGNQVDIPKSSTVGTQEESSREWTCGNSIGSSTRTPKRPPVKTTKSTPFSFASLDMANRVNTMAQLVIAPCLAPQVDEMIGSPRQPLNGTFSNGKIKATNRIGMSKNQNPFEPSSDAEEEGETKSTPPYLRGNQSCLRIHPLVFRPMWECDDSNMDGEYKPKSNAPYLYEMIIALWVQAWTSFAASMKSEAQVQGSGTTTPTWPYELVQGPYTPTSDALVAFAFIRNMSFFLPLCLKSLGLRCAQNITTKLTVPMTFLDDNHMQILVPLVETIGLGLMREAMSGRSAIANSDQMLTKALSNNGHVLDFLIGLFSLLHPSQVATLLLAYFNILEACENPTKKSRQAVETTSKSHLRRSKCAKQIRLNAVERLATLPNFSRLNFPLKFTGSYPRKKVESPSWTNQPISGHPEDDSLQKDWEKVERFPRAYWLSEFLMNQCLSICNGSCEMIIMEATKQAKATKLGGRREEISLLQVDLLRIESLAFHSILCAYELLIKRQAMDSRFQTIASSTRVAALFTRAILQQSVDAVTLLARMDPKQKVRIIWFLCLLYILQEGPDAIVRGELRRLCNPENNRISDFVSLLKLASVTCQHFIPGDESLPVLGGLSYEMTQEAFNSLSASVILLIDECFDLVSEDEYELEKLGGSLFDVLLHLLATPQSSVTLLRTLGGSAHALDKFGVLIFLKSAGNQLQHWGRIVLTMMNSAELSVRSMAVDFLVSLVCEIHQECGSIETVSICILSVLPEVVAREIALCSVSGLIKSMENAESSLWPLRRALADVEETNPLDDDRVDPQLLPSLTTLCRASQAIIDGVLVEMRLKCTTGLDLHEIAVAQRSHIVGFRQLGSLPPNTVFDADEESVLEAASFFSYETSLLQKLRWLFTLRDVHVAKEQWSEVAETLVLCSQFLIKSLDHLPNLWGPSRFELWNDCRCSPWLSSVGSSNGMYNNSNAAVIEFASAFLDPEIMAQHNISVECICLTLISVVDQVETAYVREGGMEDIAYSRFEELLNMVTSAIGTEGRRYHTEALRRVRSHISLKLGRGLTNRVESHGAQIYIRVILHGKKSHRFQESTTIPTFFEWDMPSICRVSKPTLVLAAQMKQQNPVELKWEDCICRSYAKPLIEALRNDDDKHSIILRTGRVEDTAADETKTFISAMVVQKKGSMKSRKFFIRQVHDSITEYVVAHKFPHALSRQRTLVTSEIKMSG